MNRSSLPLGVMALYKYWTSSEQTLRCSLSFQRNSGMWNLITKSSLVASVLSDSFIPAVVFLKDKVGTNDRGKDICRYEILDGQQRLTSLFEFLDDRWALHGSIEPIEFDGFTYDIAGKKFSELEPELQDAIKGYRFSIQALENYTYPEVEKLFFNINSGVALSTIQKSKAKLGNENMAFFNELLTSGFFTQSVNLTEAQAKREDDLLLLLQTISDKLYALLFDAQSCPEGIYSLTDLGALKKALLRLRLARDPVDVHEEFSLRQLNWVEAHIAGVDSFTVDKSNLDKYFKAVLYLALTSRSFTLNLLDDIDPTALGYAFKDMQSYYINSTKLLFTLLLRHLTSDSVACEDELSTVKREYQDYMRK